MTLSLTISSDAEETLRHAWGEGLDRAALEALAIEGFRSGKLSRFEVQSLLGLSDHRETEKWLGDRGVNLNYSSDDLTADRATLEKVLGPIRR